MKTLDKILYYWIWFCLLGLAFMLGIKLHLVLFQ